MKKGWKPSTLKNLVVKIRLMSEISLLNSEKKTNLLLVDHFSQFRGKV